MKTQTQSDVDFNSVIGLKIKARRRELRLTQTELANSLGVTFQQIQKYEKGINACSAKRIVELSNALNKPILYFFENEKKEVQNDQSKS